MWLSLRRKVSERHYEHALTLCAAVWSALLPTTLHQSHIHSTTTKATAPRYEQMVTLIVAYAAPALRFPVFELPQYAIEATVKAIDNGDSQPKGKAAFDPFEREKKLIAEVEGSSFLEVRHSGCFSLSM